MTCEQDMFKYSNMNNMAISKCAYVKLFPRNNTSRVVIEAVAIFNPWIKSPQTHYKGLEVSNCMRKNVVINVVENNKAKPTTSQNKPVINPPRQRGKCPFVLSEKNEDSDQIQCNVNQRHLKGLSSCICMVMRVLITVPYCHQLNVF